ncbi:transcription initiation factor TFIID subunit 7 [Botrytis cinerea]
MSGPFKLKLSLKTNGGTNASPGPSTPTTPSALTPGGSKPKIKLSSKPAAGRAPKPTQKLVDSRKRVKKEDDSGDETISVIPRKPNLHDEPAKKKVKISIKPKAPAMAGVNGLPKTPVMMKAKIKGKPPKRPLGEGYDSEASDTEKDPSIEEAFIFRMIPGDDCDYLRTCITEKKMGINPKVGGADVQMKFFHAEGRRAAVIIRGNVYAATLVDLPCIVEGMKSWDKRGWYKSADICQMLWIYQRVENEEEAKTAPLPGIIDPQTFQYPHGLTAPMHLARKRRFRKRISRTAIEAVEEAVEKLLEDDRKAVSSEYKVISPEREQSSQVFSPGSYGDEGEDQYSEDEDAEGEADDGGYFSQINNADGVASGDEMGGDLEADLAAEMEAELEAGAGFEDIAATPMSMSGVAATPMLLGDTPAPNEEDDSGDESIEDGESGDEGSEADDVDDDEKARLAQLQEAKEDIVDLEKQIEGLQAQLAAQNNPILRRRIEDKSRKLKAELEIKKSSIGEAEDD